MYVFDVNPRAESHIFVPILLTIVRFFHGSVRGCRRFVLMLQHPCKARTNVSHTFGQNQDIPGQIYDRCGQKETYCGHIYEKSGQMYDKNNAENDLCNMSGAKSSKFVCPSSHFVRVRFTNPQFQRIKSIWVSFCPAILAGCIERNVRYDRKKRANISITCITCIILSVASAYGNRRRKEKTETKTGT